MKSTNSGVLVVSLIIVFTLGLIALSHSHSHKVEDSISDFVETAA